MSNRKRKRAWDAECTSFPDETPLGLRKANVGTTVAMSSISSAWLRCGDGFQSTSMFESSESSEKKSRANKHLGPLLTSAEGTLGVSTAENPEFADIIWSSSGSDLSDDENKILISKLYNQKSHGSKAQTSYSKHNLLSEDRSSEGEPQFIDWEKDSDAGDGVDECNGSGKDDSALDISDSDSCASSNSLPVEEKEDELRKTVSAEISEYSSDSENPKEGQVDTESSNFKFTKKQQSSSEADLPQVTGRSASDWLKSAQALLQTPKKQSDKTKTSRTPEDSAKKRKLLRGGLAERLNRLQNRERSAISFWKHQCVSHHKTSSGGKSVLIVKILEVHEECAMQVVLCQQLEQFSADSSSEDDVVDTEPRLKVLFTKETAARLKGGPQDIVHIYPPWQKLLLHNENVPVIMNTYFSQKVLLKEHVEVKDKTHCPEKLHIRRNIISLAQIFRLNDLRDNLPQESAVNQVICTNTIMPKTVQTCSNPESMLHPFALSAPNDSLLEVVESQGAAGWKEMQVQVVVQRAYCLPAREGFRCQPPGNNPIHYATPILNSDHPNIRLCLLVQDAYGMFSEVQLQTPCSAENIEQHSRRWEGKSCILTGMRILQRTTRGRALGLFSLIDSLWPPLVPLKVPGQSQDCEAIKTNLPPPSFCYILTAPPDPRHINVDEEGQISNLYLPPAVSGLKEILQVGDCNQRCSFWAQVIYRRLQIKCSAPMGQRELWLFVTDFTLQDGAKGNCGTPKTVPVYFTSSCVLEKEVMEALTTASHCVMFFKDALRGNGRIICVERTVLSLQKPLLYTAAEADFCELTGPVKLDELDFTKAANSICTIRGTVSGVNESTAFSWPTCNRCSNGKLEQYPQDSYMGRTKVRDFLLLMNDTTSKGKIHLLRKTQVEAKWGSYYCSLCSQTVILPVLKIHLEVFLHCPSRPQCTVKVKLLQKTISSLLMSSSTEDGSYEVKNVLGKEVGPLNCYVQSVTNHPSCVGLEEIVLLEAGRN